MSKIKLELFQAQYRKYFSLESYDFKKEKPISKRFENAMFKNAMFHINNMIIDSEFSLFSDNDKFYMVFSNNEIIKMCNEIKENIGVDVKSEIIKKIEEHQLKGNILNIYEITHTLLKDLKIENEENSKFLLEEINDQHHKILLFNHNEMKYSIRRLEKNASDLVQEYDGMYYKLIAKFPNESQVGKFTIKNILNPFTNASQKYQEMLEKLMIVAEKIYENKKEQYLLRYCFSQNFSKILDFNNLIKLSDNKFEKLLEEHSELSFDNYSMKTFLFNYFIFFKKHKDDEPIYLERIDQLIEQNCISIKEQLYKLINYKEKSSMFLLQNKLIENRVALINKKLIEDYKKSIDFHSYSELAHLTLDPTNYFLQGNNKMVNTAIEIKFEKYEKALENEDRVFNFLKDISNKFDLQVPDSIINMETNFIKMIFVSTNLIQTYKSGFCIEKTSSYVNTLFEEIKCKVEYNYSKSSSSSLSKDSFVILRESLNKSITDNIRYFLNEYFEKINNREFKELAVFLNVIFENTDIGDNLKDGSFVKSNKLEDWENEMVLKIANFSEDELRLKLKFAKQRVEQEKNNIVKNTLSRKKI